MRLCEKADASGRLTPDELRTLIGAGVTDFYLPEADIDIGHSKDGWFVIEDSSSDDGQPHYSLSLEECLNFKVHGKSVLERLEAGEAIGTSSNALLGDLGQSAS